jgi:hypothetical protein
MGVPYYLRAEIIPTEPDPDNAGEGRANRDSSHSIG